MQKGTWDPNAQRWQGILSKGNSPRSYSFYTESPSECLHLSAGGGSVCTTDKIRTQ